MKKNFYIAAVVLLMMPASIGLAGVADTKHNLASWGPAGRTYKSATETEVCKFCHTPHSAIADTPLWGHKKPVAAFTKFSSVTLVIDADNTYDYRSGVKGSSLLCMGCHDGVTALGALANETIADVGPSDYLTATDLRNKHPVSFVYNSGTVGTIIGAKGDFYGLPDAATANGTIKNDFVAEKVRREGGRVECTICHDPHEDRGDDPVNLPFWVSSSIGGENSHDSVCKACHSPAQPFKEYSFFGEYSSL